MLGRIYVPIRMGGRLVGWQGRYAGELDWGATGKPKYYNAPGMRKGQLLYNYDQALRQPLVVVVEGVTDVWRVGPAGVALFGKSASPEQARLLAAGWHGKPVVVLLDADAADEAEKVRRQVAALHPEQVVVVTLPDGLDPGSCPRDELWKYLLDQAIRQGANLPAEQVVAA
jgi:DNA primase